MNQDPETLKKLMRLRNGLEVDFDVDLIKAILNLKDEDLIISVFCILNQIIFFLFF